MSAYLNHKFLKLSLGTAQTLILNRISKFFRHFVAVLMRIHGPLLVYGQIGLARGSWLERELVGWMIF